MAKILEQQISWIISPRCHNVTLKALAHLPAYDENAVYNARLAKIENYQRLVPHFLIVKWLHSNRIFVRWEHILREPAISSRASIILDILERYTSISVQRHSGNPCHQ